MDVKEISFQRKPKKSISYLQGTCTVNGCLVDFTLTDTYNEDSEENVIEVPFIELPEGFTEELILSVVDEIIKQYKTMP